MAQSAHKPVTIIVMGCGQRGRCYSVAALALAERVQVTGVAEPNERIREAFIADYAPHCQPELVYNGWEELLEKDRQADAVAICVQDQLHRNVAVAAAKKGYHILCEKPLATTLKDCVEIIDAVKQANVVFGIGHVLRYNGHNAFIHQTLKKGILGDILNINHTEPIGFWHFAHSYVRGNWSVEANSTFSLMAKSCHDIDIIRSYFACCPQSKIQRVSSFGGLTHFRKSRKPKQAGNATKCSSCTVANSCPYSAQRIYLEPFKRGIRHWPIDILVPPTSTVGDLEDALAKTNYGSCVYELGNDVVDNQVVSLLFETEAGPATASFTMIATSKEQCDRITRIYGSHGVLTSDSVGPVSIFDFETQKETLHHIEGETEGSHGGGDQGLFNNFVSAVEAVLHHGQEVSTAQQDFLAVTLDEILQSHRTVFAAESSRRTGGAPVDPSTYDESW